MAKVLEFTGPSRIDLPARKVLGKALDRDLSDVIVIGRTAEGHLYFHASQADGADVLWLMELTKKHLLSGELED